MDGTPLGRGTKDENSGCGCGGEEKGGWLPNKHSLQSYSVSSRGLVLSTLLVWVAHIPVLRVCVHWDGHCCI